MKRDMDMVRSLLLKIEAEESGETYYTDDQDECYHLQIMIDGGLINGWVRDDGVDGFSAEIDRMTWKGHEFLEAIRNEGVWEKVKAHFKEKGVGMALDTIVAFAGHVIVQMANN